MTMGQPEREQPVRWKVTVAEDETSVLFEAADAPLGESVLILGHGASTNMEHRTMERLAREFLRQGLHVARFNFLYTEKKKGPPDRMPRLMECFTAVVEAVRERVRPKHVFIGGHSMGGRAASLMAAEGFACDGVLLLAYPLHPAGQPEKRRDAHLAQIRQPVLCLNGTKDELCQQELMEAVVEKLPPTWTNP